MVSVYLSTRAYIAASAISEFFFSLLPQKLNYEKR